LIVFFALLDILHHFLNIAQCFPNVFLLSPSSFNFFSMLFCTPWSFLRSIWHLLEFFQHCLMSPKISLALFGVILTSLIITPKKILKCCLEFSWHCPNTPLLSLWCYSTSSRWFWHPLSLPMIFFYVLGALSTQHLSPKKKGKCFLCVEIPDVGYIDSIGILKIFLR
jgi:hypothetical protein